MVGFEPTYTGATTLGLNHLTTPTMLVFFALGFVAAPSAKNPAYLSESFSHPKKKNGDPNRARTGDLQRDRLAF